MYGSLPQGAKIPRRSQACSFWFHGYRRKQGSFETSTTVSNGQHHPPVSALRVGQLIWPPEGYLYLHSFDGEAGVTAPSRLNHVVQVLVSSRHHQPFCRLRYQHQVGSRHYNPEHVVLNDFPGSCVLTTSVTPAVGTEPSTLPIHALK
jgi:hypothetical protein